MNVRFLLILEVGATISNVSSEATVAVIFEATLGAAVEVDDEAATELSDEVKTN